MVTKILKTGGAITLGLLLMGTASRAGAAESDAAKYEQQATAVQASIDEQAAKRAVNMRPWTNYKVHVPLNVLAADKQYGEAIAALEEKKEAWLVLAKLHKAQALEGEAGLNTGESAVN